MTPREVARVLDEIATLGELNGDNPFRSRAFAAAARALESSTADLPALAREGRLTTLNGVGPGIAEVVDELVRTGESRIHEELRSRTPPGLHEVLRIPGLGTRRVHTLHSDLGIDGLDALEAAGREGRIAALSGFGAKTEQKILGGISFVRATRGRRRYPDALGAAVPILERIRTIPGVSAVEIVGALRRRCEVVDRVDLVAAAEHPRAVLEGFSGIFGDADAGESSDGAVALRMGGEFPVHLRCVSPDRFVAAVVWETGSEAHLRELRARAAERGVRLDRSGLWRGNDLIPLPTEGALYAALDLPYVAPELREGGGEVVAAAEGALPRLVEPSDLRGTFHCHTTYSDGKATVAEMAEAARARGWSYLGLADHSPSAGYAGGVSPARLREQHREIDAWNAEHGGTGEDRFRVFKGTESDILPDGSLDYPDEILASFDYVVGSVHSSFGLPEKRMTERVIRAIRNPFLTILGHPTGRLLLDRDAYAVDMDAIIDAAAEHGVAIEINADPHRLDLDWRHLRRAAERGVLIPIDPDAHSVAGLDNVAFGVNVARKGWLEARSVLNTWTLEEVEEYFAARKQNR